jgi:hypothetical protein
LGQDRSRQPIISAAVHDPERHFAAVKWRSAKGPSAPSTPRPRDLFFARRGVVGCRQSIEPTSRRPIHMRDVGLQMVFASIGPGSPPGAFFRSPNALHHLRDAFFQNVSNYDDAGVLLVTPAVVKRFVRR